MLMCSKSMIPLMFFIISTTSCLDPSNFSKFDISLIKTLTKKNSLEAWEFVAGSK